MKVAIDDYILGDSTGMSIALIGILYFASVLVGAVSNYAM